MQYQNTRMQDKNSKLAKENSALKAIISKKSLVQEEIMKKTIKAEYSQILSYKEMLKAIEQNIQNLEEALCSCKDIHKNILKNKRLLFDTTNLNREIGDGAKDPPVTSSAYFKEDSKDENYNDKRNKAVLLRRDTQPGAAGKSQEYSGEQKYKKAGKIDIEKELFTKWGSQF